MTRILVAALAAATSARAAVPPPEAAPHVVPAARVLRVAGDGRASVKPDVAVVLAGVEVNGKVLAPAVAEASSRMRRVLDAVAKLGVAERDVQTTRHEVQVERPWVEGRPGDITGYTVSDEVRIRVRDLSKLGAVLDRVVQAGSNAVRGLTFERDDPTPARAEALARAIAAARAKAESMARAAGVALAEVIAVEEGGGVRPFPVVRADAMRAVSAEGAPVAPGELEVSADVSLTFAIR
jgi:uncharacterized protein YggE